METNESIWTLKARNLRWPLACQQSDSVRCAGQSVPVQYQGGMYRCTVTANPRGTQAVALPCGSLYCLGLAYLGLVQIDSDHPCQSGNGLNRENNNNTCNNIAHGAMIPGRAGQRLDPCGRRTTLDPLIERYSAFHH